MVRTHLRASLLAAAIAATLALSARPALAVCDELSSACCETQTCCFPTDLGLLICIDPTGGNPNNNPSGTGNTGEGKDVTINGCSNNQTCAYASFVAGSATSHGVAADHFGSMALPPPPPLSPDKVKAPSLVKTLPASPAIRLQGPVRPVGVSRPTAGDPVDLATGELVIEESDLSFPGYGVSFNFVRTYRSRIDYSGPFGPSWDHSYNQRLVPLRGLLDEIVFNDGHGNPLGFIRRSQDPGAWHYEGPKGFKSTLVAEVDQDQHVTGWSLTDPDGTVRRFDAAGLLASIRDHNGIGLTVTWEQAADQTWRVQSVTDSSDFDGQPRVIQFTYGSSGRLMSVSEARSGLATSYNYNANGPGELSYARSAEGRTRQYVYQPRVGPLPVQPDFVPAQQVEQACALACQEHGAAFGAGPACTSDGVCPTHAQDCADSCVNHPSGTCADCGGYCQTACQTQANLVDPVIRDACAIETRSREPTVNLDTPGRESLAFKECTQHCDAYCAQFQGDTAKYNCCRHGDCQTTDAQGHAQETFYRECPDSCYGYYAGMDVFLWLPETWGGDGGACVQDALHDLVESCKPGCTADCGTTCTSGCIDQCTNNCEPSCRAQNLAVYGGSRVFGQQTDIFGNITDVQDAAGNTLLHVDYGMDQLAETYDAVILQKVTEAPQFTTKALRYVLASIDQLGGVAKLPALCGIEESTYRGTIVVDSLGRSKEYTFNRDGRLIEEEGPVLNTPGDVGVPGGMVFHSYGADGLLAGTLLGDKEICLQRNALGDVETVSETGGGNRHAHGNDFPEVASRHLRMTYRVYPDGFSRPLARFDDDTSTQLGDSFSWDDHGNLTGISDAAGVQYATVTPDPVSGRPKTITYDDGSSKTFDYLAGTLRQQKLVDPVSSQTLTTVLEPDVAGRPKHAVSPFGETTDWTWDPTFNVPTQIDITRETGVERHITTYTDGLLTLDTRNNCTGGGCQEESRVSYSYDFTGRVRRTESAGVSAPTTDTCSLYSPEGLLLETVTARGSLVHFKYDALDRLVSVQSGKLASGYGSSWLSGCPAAYTGADAASGTVLTRTYDEFYNLRQITDGRGKTKKLDYDGLGRVIKTRDPDGALTHYGYDVYGEIAWVAVYDPALADPPHQEPTLTPASPPTNPPAGLLSFQIIQRDALARVKEVDTARFGGGDNTGWQTSTFVYDRPNRRTTSTQLPGDATIVDVDGIGNPVHVLMSGLGGTVRDMTRTYDYQNRQVSESISAPVTGGRVVTKRSWNSGGLPTVVATSAGAEISRVDYDAFNRPHIQTLPQQGYLQFGYDGRNQVATVSRYGTGTSPISTESFGFDANGNLTGRPGATYTFDALDRLTRIDGPAFGSGDARYYDGASSVVLARGMPGMVTGYQRDGSGRVLAQTEYASSSPLPATFDGNVAALNLPQLRQLSFGYDAAGHLTRHGSTEAVGDTILTRNSLGAVTSEAVDGINEVAHSYDDRGLPVIDTINRVIASRRQFDAAGRLTSVASVPVGFPVVAVGVQFGYSGEGGPVTETRGNGVVSTNTYDALGRLTATTAKLGSTPIQAQTWGIPLDGIPRTEVNTSGTFSESSVFSVDGLGRLIAESHGVSQAVPAIAATDDAATANTAVEPLIQTGNWKRFGLGDTDNWLGSQTSSGSVVNSFDDAGRYQQFEGRTVGRGLAGDPNAAGGAVSSTDDVLLTPNPAGQLVGFGFSSSGQTLQLGYDALGRLARRTLMGDATNIGYDGARRVVESRSSGLVHVAIFGDDADDVLAQVDVGFRDPVAGVTLHQLDIEPPIQVTPAAHLDFPLPGAPDELTAQIVSSTGTTVTCSYSHQGGSGWDLTGCDSGATASTTIVAAKVLVSAGTATPVHRVLSDLSYAHRDRLGSLAALSNGTGAITELYSYKAFGARTIRDPAGEERRCCNEDNIFGFQGHPQDEYTGLVDMRARTYWPFLGQFLSADPIGFGGGRNLFAFVGGAPLGLTDPFGLAAALPRAADSASSTLWRAANFLFPATTGWATRPAIGTGNPYVDFVQSANQQAVQALGNATRETVKFGTQMAGFALQAPAAPADIAGEAGAFSLASQLGAEGAETLGGRAPDVVIDAASGTVTSNISNGFRRLPIVNPNFTPDAGSVLQNITTAEVDNLLANPALAQHVLSPAELAAAKTNPGLARATFGKAVERLVGESVTETPLHSQIFRYVGGPNQPDFVGLGSAAGQTFDITTTAVRQLQSHTFKYPNLELILYDPPQVIIFP